MNSGSLHELLATAYKKMLGTIYTRQGMVEDIEIALPFGQLTVSHTGAYGILKIQKEYLLPYQLHDFISYRISITGIVHEHHKSTSSKEFYGSPILVEEKILFPIPYTYWIDYGLSEIRSRFAHMDVFRLERAFLTLETRVGWIEDIYDPVLNRLNHESDFSNHHSDPDIYLTNRRKAITRYHP